MKTDDEFFMQSSNFFNFQVDIMETSERAARKVKLYHEVWDNNDWSVQCETGHVFKLISDTVNANQNSSYEEVRQKFKELLDTVPVAGRTLILK
jgi:hypothetical protein